MARVLPFIIMFSFTVLVVCSYAGKVDRLSLPLMDKMSASLTANIDISDMKSVIKDYIDRSIKTEVEGSLNYSIDSVKEDLETLKIKLERIENVLKNKDNLKQRDLPTECSDPKIKNTIKAAGVYTVSPVGTNKFQVRCEPDGWTTMGIGFGDLNQEFWLGNKYIAQLTSDGTHQLRINLSDGKESKYAQYSSFKVGNSSTKYRLSVNGYSGNAGDGMKHQNGQSFSTYEQDNDRSSINCGAHVELQGAWWYNDCWHSSLNGKYVPPGHSYGGIRWFPWKGYSVTLQSSSMMIRKV